MDYCFVVWSVFASSGRDVSSPPDTQIDNSPPHLPPPSEGSIVVEVVPFPEEHGVLGILGAFVQRFQKLD